MADLQRQTKELVYYIVLHDSYEQIPINIVNVIYFAGNQHIVHERTSGHWLSGIVSLASTIAWQPSYNL